MMNIKVKNNSLNETIGFGLDVLTELYDPFFTANPELITKLVKGNDMNNVRIGDLSRRCLPDSQYVFSVVSTDDHVTFRLDVPGVALDDLNVSIENQHLVVSGKRFDTGFSFAKSVLLPVNEIDLLSADSKLIYGVLNVDFKRKTEKTSRKLVVK